jgi:hypothetical protein
MNQIRSFGWKFLHDERGHAMVSFPSLISAIAAIALGVGAAGDTDWLTIGSGIVLGVSLFLGGVARHRGIDYDVYTRLDKVEGK